jgi:nucleotide-binding universal stress UspA family protein
MLSPLKGLASAAISACASEQEADLIVLGTNQRKGLERFLLGSVAQGVLLDATQDVLIVPVIAADDLTING